MPLAFRIDNTRIHEGCEIMCLAHIVRVLDPACIAPFSRIQSTNRICRGFDFSHTQRTKTLENRHATPRRRHGVNRSIASAFVRRPTIASVYGINAAVHVHNHVAVDGTGGKCTSIVDSNNNNRKKEKRSFSRRHKRPERNHVTFDHNN